MLYLADNRALLSSPKTKCVFGDGLTRYIRVLTNKRHQDDLVSIVELEVEAHIRQEGEIGADGLNETDPTLIYRVALYTLGCWGPDPVPLPGGVWLDHRPVVCIFSFVYFPSFER